MAKETNSKADLAGRARRYFEHPKRRLGLPDGWDRFLAQGACEIEELRRRFPVERVELAREFLGLSSDYKPRRPDDIEEQIYRAHYSSMKIQWSWVEAVKGIMALAHLCGLLDDELLEGDRIARNDVVKELPQICEHLWPKEELGGVFGHLADEDWHGHIPLRSGILALGSRLVFAEYAVAVVEVLRKLHRNSAYTYGLCRGRTFTWAEAMVFKTLSPGPRRRSSPPGVGHGM